MELFAIAAVAYSFGIEWTCYKYISDDATDNDSIDQWKKDEYLGEKLFIEKLKELC